jgi:hypothetical protein
MKNYLLIMKCCNSLFWQNLSTDKQEEEKRAEAAAEEAFELSRERSNLEEEKGGRKRKEMKHQKFYFPLKRTREEIFKDLMRYRTDVDQGLTFKQIFCEVYSDFVEKYTIKNIRSNITDQIYDYSDDPSYYGKVSYLKQIIKRVKKTDNEFRWLSVLPVKRNEVDPVTGKKVKPYVEYRYINVKTSKTPELLEQINEIWEKRAESQIKTLEKNNKYLDVF